MPTSAINFLPPTVPVAEANLFTVPAATEYDLPVIRFVNDDTVPHQIKIWNKPGVAAGVPADLEAMLTIQPQSLYEHGPMVLPAGRVVSVQADAANVISCRPHGWAIT